MDKMPERFCMMKEKDCLLLKKRFDDYVNSFRDSDSNLCNKLQEKLEHIIRVADNAIFIARKEGWEDFDISIAELCGLFHDIGRFSQYIKYRTYNDSESVNHGEHGYNIILQNNLFAGIPIDDCQSILNAVRFHNSLEIPNELDESSLRFTKLVRDADKLDIFYMLTEAIRTGTIEMHRDLLWNLPMGEPNPIIVNKLLANKQALYSEIKSGTDVCLLHLCWLYGMNFDASLIKLEQNNTVDLLYSIMTKNSDVDCCIKHIRNYLNHRVN